MDRIYFIIGKIIEKTQVIELNLEDVVKYSEIVGEYNRNRDMTLKDLKIAEDSAEYLRGKMESMTLGERIHIVCATRCFSKAEADELKQALEKRNYFVHEYFKLFIYSKDDKELINDEVNALKEYYSSLVSLNKKIELYKSSFENDYQKIKKVVK